MLQLSTNIIKSRLMEKNTTSFCNKEFFFLFPRKSIFCRSSSLPLPVVPVSLWSPLSSSFTTCKLLKSRLELQRDASACCIEGCAREKQAANAKCKVAAWEHRVGVKPQRLFKTPCEVFVIPRGDWLTNAADRRRGSRAKPLSSFLSDTRAERDPVYFDSLDSHLLLGSERVRPTGEPGAEIRKLRLTFLISANPPPAGGRRKSPAVQSRWKVSHSTVVWLD